VAFLGAIGMRTFIILAMLVGVLWAIDAYEYNGRYSHDLWRRAAAEGQYFSYEVQRRINTALSGH
jgi:hypothetical protein